MSARAENTTPKDPGKKPTATGQTAVSTVGTAATTASELTIDA